MFKVSKFLVSSLSQTRAWKVTIASLPTVDCVKKKAGQSVITSLARDHFYFSNMCPKEIKLHSTVYHKQMFWAELHKCEASKPKRTWRILFNILSLVMDYCNIK